MAAKVVVDTSVLVKWIKSKDEELLEAVHCCSACDAPPKTRSAGGQTI
jgi:hypothetical protein